MPKEIRSAADILGEVPASVTSQPEVTSENPPEPVAAEPAVPAAGFEDPPTGQASEEAPLGDNQPPVPVSSLAQEELSEAVKESEGLSAEQLLAEAGGGYAAPNPAAPHATAVAESTIPAKPEFGVFGSDGPEDPQLTAAALARLAQREAPAEPAKPGARDWRFVKNISFGEKMFRLDGKPLVFPRPLFVTSDPELAAQILAVAERYNIVEQ